MEDIKKWTVSIDKEVKELLKKIHRIENDIQKDIAEINKNIAVITTKMHNFVQIMELKSNLKQGSHESFLFSRNFWVTTFISVTAILVAVLINVLA